MLARRTLCSTFKALQRCIHTWIHTHKHTYRQTDTDMHTETYKHSFCYWFGDQFSMHISFELLGTDKLIWPTRAFTSRHCLWVSQYPKRDNLWWSLGSFPRQYCVHASQSTLTKFPADVYVQQITSSKSRKEHNQLNIIFSASTKENQSCNNIPNPAKDHPKYNSVPRSTKKI